MRGAPGGEGVHGRGGAAGAGVEEVAEEDEALGAVAADQRAETGEVGGGGGFGDGDADGPEGRALAEVRVGDAERAPARPPEGAVAESGQGFTGPLELDHGCLSLARA